MFKAGANLYANSVDATMLYIIYICIFLLLGITATMIFFVFKYSRKKHPRPQQIHGNVALEVAWIIIPTIIVISMFFVGIADYGPLRKTAKFDHQIEVTGFQWGWIFKYENGFKTDALQSPKNSNYTGDTLFIPVGKTTKLEIKAKEVLHSFYVPSFRLKEDAVPGKSGCMILKPETIGVYDIACAEYCGVAHSRMYARLAVVSQADFDAFLAKNAKKKDEAKPADAKEAVASTEPAAEKKSH